MPGACGDGHRIKSHLSQYVLTACNCKHVTDNYSCCSYFCHNGGGRGGGSDSNSSISSSCNHSSSHIVVVFAVIIAVVFLFGKKSYVIQILSRLNLFNIISKFIP